MKNIFGAILISLTLGKAFAEKDSHQHHGKSATTEEKSHSPSALILDHGKKWQIDLTMKENMAAIHQQFKIFDNLSKLKKATNTDARALSDIISTSTQNIISNCKMEKTKDEAFHVILGELLAVADDLKKSKKIDPALNKLAQTLKTYTEYFDHSLSN